MKEAWDNIVLSALWICGVRMGQLLERQQFGLNDSWFAWITIIALSCYFFIATARTQK